MNKKPAKPEKIPFLQVKMPPDLHKAAHAKAEMMGVTLSLVVRAMLREWVENPQAKIIF